tara:strand:+ start:566 stop:871 length:306 start_codon:yes stop_codon:yes gene_type:complete
MNLPYGNTGFNLMAALYRLSEKKDLDWSKILGDSLMLMLKPTWTEYSSKEDCWELNDPMFLHIIWLVAGHPDLYSEIEKLTDVLNDYIKEYKEKKAKEMVE